MKPSTKTLVLFLGLLILSSFSQANPGGVGPSTQDMQCGGACHGDADLNATSPYTITLEQTSTAYAGLPTSVRVEVSNLDQLQTSLIGVFLLTDTTGFEDTPEDDGWTTISHSEGGNENYLEVQHSGSSIAVEWVLRAPTSTGIYTFYASVHHGSAQQSDTPFFGISDQPIQIEVLPVPENLPRIDSDTILSTQRNNGEETAFVLSTIEVESVLVEWRLQGGQTHSFVAEQVGEQRWEIVIPATLSPDIVEWRVTLQGNDIEQTTPWLQISSLNENIDIDNTAMYIQSISLLIFSCGFYLALATLMSSPSQTQQKTFVSIEDEEDDQGGEL
ncbi:MAG: hypothetical protein VW230_04930 [Candidatus Poseidoniales archaeon]